MGMVAMPDAVTVTVFPRLDCCIPDFAGSNVALARVLREVKRDLGDQVNVEVLPTADRPHRYEYYGRMLDALVAAGYELPFADSPQRLLDLKRQASAFEAGLHPSARAIEELRRVSAHLFMIGPVVAIEGKAAFVGAVPSADELSVLILGRAHGPGESDDREVPRP